MNIFLCVTCVVLMVLGVAELIRVLTFWWTKPLTGKDFSLVVIPDSGEDCECALRAAMERLRWLDLKGPCRLICVNRGGDPEIDSICRFLMLRYPALRVCKPGEIEYNVLESEK